LRITSLIIISARTIVQQQQHTQKAHEVSAAALAMQRRETMAQRFERVTLALHNRAIFTQHCDDAVPPPPPPTKILARFNKTVATIGRPSTFG
jgi:hypothetical protein